MAEAVVIDKSFLQGIRAPRIRELVDSRTLLMSEELFYELITSSPEIRIGCFGKFPPEPNPVLLVSHIGTLVKKEIETKKPSGSPLENRWPRDFKFNPLLLANDYCLPDEELAFVEEETGIELPRKVDTFVDCSKGIPSMFPGLLDGSDAVRTELRRFAEELIAKRKSLVDFYSVFESPVIEQPLPSFELIDESWAIYRWIQVQLLFGIDLHVRYQGKSPTMTKKTYTKLEHDVIDARLLMLACLQGGFACRETKLKRWFRLLCPEGELISE